MDAQRNTVIESLGVYLPPRAVSTDEVLANCKRKILFPLELITGIESRRMATGEFSFDLAVKAVTDCLAQSKYRVADIDMVICCNISRYDAPNVIHFEPSTAVQLGAHFGIKSALTFDISNACAGVFTGIHLMDIFLKAGAIRHGLVVSGEYITHLTETAQRELKGFTDPRLACLTLGDSGIAMILEQGPNADAGFLAMEMYTLGQYSKFCVARISDKPAGGAIMMTDVVKLSSVGINEATAHAVAMQSRAGWPPELLNHLIMHQTSERTIRGAAERVNRLYGKQVCTEDNTICNLRERGNTATTSHFLAFHDHVMAGRIRSGQNVLFSVNASGLTIGTSLYICDDLPSRMLSRVQNEHRQEPVLQDAKLREADVRVRIESAGIPSHRLPVGSDTMELSRAAAESCLERSRFDRSEIDVLIYTGIYRTGFVCEPAIAAMLAGDLALNDGRSPEITEHPLCFDLVSGSAGVLKACYVGTRLIQSRHAQRVMIVASEVECNLAHSQKLLLGLVATGSAIILEAASSADGGFGHFMFQDFTEHLGAFRTYCDPSVSGGALEFCRDPRLEVYYLDCIERVVSVYIKDTLTDLSEIRVVLAPQMSSQFLNALGDRLGLRHAMVDATEEGKDLYTSSLPYAFHKSISEKMVQPGDLGLFITAGSGIQVGCALYRF